MEELKKQVEEAKARGWNDITVNVCTLEYLLEHYCSTGEQIDCRAEKLGCVGCAYNN